MTFAGLGQRRGNSRGLLVGQVNGHSPDCGIGSAAW
jgi:hypothetical protein